MKPIGSSGLGYGQTFVIILGFLITSALIFVFGIWVGRDVVERRLAKEDRAVRGVIAARPTETREEADVGFYEQLKQKAEQRIQQAQTPTVGIAPTATVVVPTVAIAAQPTGMPAQRTVVPTATAVAVVSKPAPHPTQPRLPTTAHRPAEDEWADAGWTVQVNATTDHDEARTLAARLRSRGFDAYVVQAPLRGQTWYRVRVGRLPTRDQAKDLEERLRRSEGMDAAYITPQ